MIDEAIEELTKMLIKQDLKEKDSGEEEYITIKRTELIKHCIKLLKLLKKY